MKRIQGATVSADLHGVGKAGFKDGNKTLGILATIVNALFMNQTQEEIIAVIEASGRTPDDTNQLLPSILSLIKGGDYKDSVRFTTTANIVLSGLGIQAGGDWPAALTAGDRILPKNQTAGAENGIWIAAAGAWTRATDADTGAELNSGAIVPVESGTLNADTNWQLTTDGTVVIGTTALTFATTSSQFSSNAEAQAFAITNKAISPSTLAQAFKGSNQSLTTNGYQRLPGGLILQWGSNLASAVADTAVTFPIAFPTALLAITGTPIVNTGNLHMTFTSEAESISGFTFNSITSGGRNAFTCMWFALGY